MEGIIDGTFILPNVWLGNITTVKHYRNLINSGFTHVLSVMTHEDLHDRNIIMPDELTWSVIPVNDDREDHLYQYLKTAIQMIEGAVIGGGRILVHCVGGISRSPTVIIAYVMWKLGLRLTAAIEYVRNRCSYIDPNWTFYGDLVKFEQDLYKQMEMGDVPNKTK